MVSIDVVVNFGVVVSLGVVVVDFSDVVVSYKIVCKLND